MSVDTTRLYYQTIEAGNTGNMLGPIIMKMRGLILLSAQALSWTGGYLQQL